MITILTTTDGGDREDANTFYTGVIVVDAPDTDLHAVMQAVAAASASTKVTGGGSHTYGGKTWTTPYMVHYDRNEHNDYTQVDDNDVIDFLIAAGYKASSPTIAFLVGESRW